MKIKNIIKRTTSAIAALALGVTSLTSALASAATDAEVKAAVFNDNHSILRILLQTFP